MAYDIIIKKTDLSNIDLHEKYDLYTTLLGMTKVCNKCKTKTCIGGYNCQYGVMDDKYKICIKDLKYGDCTVNCQFIHLTKQGLKPYCIFPPKNTLPHEETIKKIDLNNKDLILNDGSDDNDDERESDDCLISIFE
jgi:hypothetical protein